MEKKSNAQANEPEEKSSCVDTEPCRCNFCGKHQKDVDKIIKGNKVYICDRCVDICVQIIDNDPVEEDYEEFFKDTNDDGSDGTRPLHDQAEQTAGDFYGKSTRNSFGTLHQPQRGRAIYA